MYLYVFTSYGNISRCLDGYSDDYDDENNDDEENYDDKDDDDEKYVMHRSCRVYITPMRTGAYVYAIKENK